MPVRDVDSAVGDVVAGAVRAFGKMLADLHVCLEQSSREMQHLAGATRLIATHPLASGSRGGRLVDELWSCTGQSVLRPSDVELLPMLSSLAEVLRNTLDVRIDVSVSVERDCPPCHADAGALEDALLNLVVDARDAMQHEGGTLRLTARSGRLPDGLAAVEIDVSGSRIGVTHHIAQRAADPCFADTADEPMAGLALAAVDCFATRSHGDLTLHMAAGTGTTACLRLPAVPRLEQPVGPGRPVR